MAYTFLLGSVGLLVVSWGFFFAAPVVMSLLAVLLAAGAVVQLGREAN